MRLSLLGCSSKMDNLVRWLSFLVLEWMVQLRSSGEGRGGLRLSGLYRPCMLNLTDDGCEVAMVAGKGGSVGDVCDGRSLCLAILRRQTMCCCWEGRESRRIGQLQQYYSIQLDCFINIYDQQLIQCKKGGNPCKDKTDQQGQRQQ